MLVQVPLLGSSVGAVGTGIRPFSGVDPHMSLQIGLSFEPFVTERTVVAGLIIIAETCLGGERYQVFQILEEVVGGME